MTLADLPELVNLHADGGVRIPPGTTVPLTPRVRRLLDTPPLRRMGSVRQLGLVSLVYPGAVHSRLEHSLGVYRLALEFLTGLQHDDQFCSEITADDAAAFIVTAFLHDIGHWPYCHPIEDMQLDGMPHHETRLPEILKTSEIGELLYEDWGLPPERLTELILGTADDSAGKILHSMLSGPIDVDKMDYLARDSLHAGVPYGRHFDQERLLKSLCLNASGEALAITDKGRTAAELMVFARYVMFSEVYWHHAVRAATAMLQRAIWLCRDHMNTDRLVQTDESGFVQLLTTAASNGPAQTLVDGLFGSRRQLFKQVVAFDATSHPALHAALAGLPYEKLVSASNQLTKSLRYSTGETIAADSLIIDAPPAEREIEFRLQVRCGRGTASHVKWRSLTDVSPVTQALAHKQFDNLVKQVRLFARADVAELIRNATGLEEQLLEAGQSIVK